MLNQDKGECPLCRELFPADQLRSHALAEAEEIRNVTIEIIKSQHPEWVEEDGVCPRCWQYYQSL